MRVVREVQNETVQPNDMLVTITSSKLPGFLARPDQKRNHATIADEGMGNTVLNPFSCGSSFNLATQTLPVTGTYTVTVDPNAASTGSISVRVTSP